MHLRSNKNSLKKVHKKTTRKTQVKNMLVKELKSNTNENVSYSIEGQQMDLIKLIRIYNECIHFKYSRKRRCVKNIKYDRTN